MLWETCLNFHDCNSELSLACSSRSCLKLLTASSWSCTAKPWHAKYSDEDNITRSAFVASFISFASVSLKSRSDIHAPFCSCCCTQGSAVQIWSLKTLKSFRSFLRVRKLIFYKCQVGVLVPGSNWKKGIHVISSTTGPQNTLSTDRHRQAICRHPSGGGANDP